MSNVSNYYNSAAIPMHKTNKCARISCTNVDFVHRFYAQMLILCTKSENKIIFPPFPKIPQQSPQLPPIPNMPSH